MRHFHFFIGLALACAFNFQSCKKEPTSQSNSTATDSKISSDDFNFATSKNISINIRLLSNNDQPLKGVVLNIFKPGTGKSEESIFKAVSDANGYVTGTVSIPSYVDTLVLEPDYIGLLSHIKALLPNNSIKAIVGGTNGYFGDIVFDKPQIQTISKSNFNSIFATNYVFPDGSSNFSTNVSVAGLPTYLASPSDIIDANFLTTINSTLKKDLSLTNPDMVGNDATSVLNITQQSDVYVTYVSSSAAFYNTIGYYTYNTASGPPTTAANITKVTYIFPNTRYTEAKYKGDTYKGILAGNKVKLGNFPAGTTIGFVLFQNAWDAVNRAVRTNSTKFYSNSALNPETNTAIRRHNVLLHDVSKDVYVMGFEDQLRSSTDNDFNDVVLYATATTKDAISSFQVANLPKADDTDGDGVLNIADKFPSDPNKAYISYFPSEVNWGTVAFEDNWPSKGDYDLNDLVVSYRYMYTSNANNQVVDITGDFAVSAAGASYKNGFGVQFPFSANIVSEVTGQKLTGSIITKAANGLEAGQLKAVIIPFDDHETLIKNNTGNLFINTENDKPKIAGDTAHVFIKLTTPQSTLTIGSAPFNPFLISNQRRGYEIHLPGMAPTDKADTKLFGTLSDRSILGNVSTYYKTDMNWPWAMSFTETFNFPVELQSIDKAYPHFLEWAGSTASPKPYLDWYSNTASGYRNSQYIYGK